MTTTINLFEAKTRLRQLVERVEHGEEILITRHERPVARLIPAEWASREDLIRSHEDFLKLRGSLRFASEPLGWRELKQMAREGLA